MDNQMLSAHITIIADTLAHIDAALSVMVVFLVIATTIGAFFFLAWLFTHLVGGDDDE